MVDEHTLALLHFDESLTKNDGIAGDFTADGDLVTLSTSTKKFGTGSMHGESGSGYGHVTKVFDKYVGTYTLEAWVRGEGDLFWTGWGSAQPVVQVMRGNQSNSTIRFKYCDYYPVTSFEATRTFIDTWFHLAAVVDGDNSKKACMFINGKLVYETVIPDGVNPLPIQRIMIGGFDKDGGHGTFGGYIDEVRISDIVRYTKDFTPQTHPFGTQIGLIKSAQPVNLLNKTSITGFTTVSSQPANTETRIVFQVDGKWKKLTTANSVSTLEDVATQTITADSVLSEGGTISQLASSTSVPGFAGKLVYPAVAMKAESAATAMPTFKLSAIKGIIDTTVNVYNYTDYSQEYALGDSDVTIVSVVAKTTTTGEGSVDIQARLYQNDAWGNYMPLSSVQMQRASKLQLKAVYKVKTTSSTDSARIDEVAITYNTAGAVVSDATTDIVTVTERFTNDLVYVRAYVKHEKLLNSDIRVYCSLRKKPQIREMYQFGNGTGSLETYQLSDTGINQDTLRIFVDGKYTSEFSYNTETAQVTLASELGTVLSASYEYGWESSEWNQMRKGSTQVNDSGLYTTEYSYAVTASHAEPYTVAAVKYSLFRPEGVVTNETIGVGTGKRQIIQLPYYAKKETIVCTGSWSYDYESRQLTVIANKGENIVISYRWIAETPRIHSVAAGWAEKED